MDQTTHMVRRRYWQEIVDRCLSRPEGMSAKSWLDKNGINRKSYYYWLRKLREETYAQKCVPAVADVNTDITFAEINIPDITQPETGTAKPTAYVKRGDVTIEFTNEVSSELMSRLLKEVFHA